MKYLITFEAYATNKVKTDRAPYTYQWYGAGMTSTGAEEFPWSYEETPPIKRKPRDIEDKIKEKREKRKKKSKEDRKNKNSVDINLNDDRATFSRNTKTPGKAG